MEFRVFGDVVLFRVGAVVITETMVTSASVSVALAGLGVFFGIDVQRRPHSTASTIARLAVQWLDDTALGIIGSREPMVAAFCGSLFLFIAACNLSGQLPGVHPATGSLATTSALAVVVLLAVPFAGIRARGVRHYVRHYFSPNPLLFPLHLISEISRTVALSMRLFGNIMSGHLVVALLVALGGFLVPVPFMALDILIGLLQAYIFAVLSIVFIGAAVGAGEGK